MKIQVEIDDEVLEEAFRKNLKWHMRCIGQDLMVLRSKKKLERFEQEDKEYFERLYPALKIVGEYFGVENK